MRFIIFVCVFSVSSSMVCLAGTAKVEFNRDIRPILSENCFACHGHDKNQRKAKLRLDVRDVALERGAIVPGKPQESKLIDHVFAEDPDDRMPPPKTHKTLTSEQKNLLKQWIAEGAVYEPHWAYIQPKRWPAPHPKKSGWVKNPIDAFVLAALEAKNIQPSPEADKRTLLRRLSLDLIGLPPTPEEMAAFLKDSSSRAYERQVDRLLSSPHYGERMTVPWLDVVRFTDTVGYHGDQNQRIFPYRDYVISAFNQNKPFDEFTIQQIAGDLLPNATTEDKVASGFNRLNMVTREGGAQPKEYLAKYAADRVRTVSMAWLGSTMGCAECHDHKFDPFTSKDFYSMEAFFADLKQWGVYMDYGYTPNPDLKGFSNDHPFPPEIQVDSPYLKARQSRLEQQAREMEAEAAHRLTKAAEQEKEFEAWRKRSLDFLKQYPSGWATPSPEVALRFKDTNTVAETNFSVASDGMVSFGKTLREDTKLTLPASNLWVAAIRVEIAPRKVQTKSEAEHRKRFDLKPVVKLKDGKGDEKKVDFYFADADHKEARYVNGAEVIGVKDMWQVSPKDGKQEAVYLLEEPLRGEAGDELVVDLGAFAAKSVRVSVSPFAASNPLQCGLGHSLSEPLGAGAVEPGSNALVDETYLLSTGWDSEVLGKVRKLEDGIRECREGKAWTMVSEKREPLVTRILPRGNWQDESGEIVQPAVPHFLPQLLVAAGERETRLDLARWLVWTNNPLTARAVMNRMWKQFFGAGISAVVDDLGIQGEWPTNPHLLDWLACEFMTPKWTKSPAPGDQPAHPWDVKHMVKLLVMSSTYRQASNESPELKEVDPDNRLLAFQNPRRLEAEFVRDNALYISGLLNQDIGGPSCFPYQPRGYYANLQFPDRDYIANNDDRQYRRGVYMHWQRTFLHPMLANFDAPSREECVAARNVSNTPQQALTLLNDPTFVEASRAFAARVLSSPARSDAEKIDTAFQLAVLRPARKKEQTSLLAFLDQQREYYSQDNEEAAKLIRIGNSPESKASKPAELAAWTQVCRVILNLQETITRY